jgi:hypothetical protein
MQPLIFVLYDGINNSVFHSQVLIPLQERARNNAQPIHMVSFERQIPNTDFMKGTTITLHTLKRLPFLGRLSMWHSTYLLRNFLKQFPSYELMARGPLAGFLCSRIAEQGTCTKLTIQARGLLAEEYSYTHNSFPTFVHRWWHTWRRNGLASIEQSVYGKKEHKVPTTIETVSTGLKEYLITTFKTDATSIRVSIGDIPEIIDEHTKALWRSRAREELGIPQDMQVYCYNGSVKAWQCPDMTIAFFKEMLAKEPRSFLLLLTQDRKPFLSLLKQAGIPESHYRLMNVPHSDIYYYLAACDMGIIFRKPSIINWVSRPTKVLEYRATRLKIMHNNTIHMLSS